MDASLDDEFIAVIMLSGLSEDYSPMVMALESANVKLTSDFVKTKLLQDTKLSGNSNSDDKAFYSKGNKVHNKKKTVVCYKCNKEGHFKSECPNNKTVVNKTKDKTASDVNKKDKALFVSNVEDSTSKEWYVDSGATTHISNRKDWFQDYMEDSNYNVTVANGQALNAHGTGKVVVFTKDGPKSISNIVYVPGKQIYFL